jgi:3'-phosphoadenosine 5'-phosphosulfate sulfotransferase (PAPS reductase)/FAD synthetase
MTQTELLPRGDELEPEAIIASAASAAEGPIVSRVCLISGGGDSTVTAHRCRAHYDELAFIDTGTALPGVRDFVIGFAASIGKPLRIYESGPAFAERGRATPVRPLGELVKRRCADCRRPWHATRLALMRSTSCPYCGGSS